VSESVSSYVPSAPSSEADSSENFAEALTDRRNSRREPSRSDARTPAPSSLQSELAWEGEVQEADISNLPAANPNSPVANLPAAHTNLPLANGDPASASAQLLTYFPEIAVNSALLAVLTQGDIGMLLPHRGSPDSADSDRPAWVNVLNQRTCIYQAGTLSPRSKGRVFGLQIGADLLTRPHHHIGVYGGTLEWDYKVTASLNGLENQKVGQLQGDTRYAGLYWAYQAATGWYSNLVIQQGWQQGKSHAVTGGSHGLRGQSTLASIEVGKPLPFTSHAYVEPQLQLIKINPRLRDTQLPAATRLSQQSGNFTIGRAGLQLKANTQTIQPYVAFNVWHGLQGTDTMSVQGPAGATAVATKRGYTSGELVTGGNWRVSRHVSVRADLGRMFPIAGRERVSAQYNVSAGLNILL
jgi:outer membrane autotransporter protein